jgi:hypothetical protein
MKKDKELEYTELIAKQDKKIVKLKQELAERIPRAKVQEIDSLLDDEKWLTAQLLLKKLLSGEGEQ